MNSIARTKPVMDVAMPKRPGSAPIRAARAKAAVSAVATKPKPLIRRKPLVPVSATPSKTAKAAPAERLSQQRRQQQRQRPAKTVRQPSEPAPILTPTPAPLAGQTERRIPVALITVTAFVILILSVVAVAVYVTTQMA